MTTQSITDFLTQVYIQQAAQPKYPKQYYLLTFNLPYTEAQAINYINTLGCSYLSCQFFNGVYWWEFINSTNISSFTNYEFIYVQATIQNFYKLRPLIPFYYSWDNSPVTYFNYPSQTAYVNTNAYNWGAYYTGLISGAFTHPFLPSFQFTGNSCLNKNRLVYEYQDTNGWIGPLNQTYLSPYRPLGLGFPLGVTLQSNLIIDMCASTLVGLYPAEGDVNWVGTYIGYYTNSTYSPHIRFWLYQGDSSIFLLDQPPYQGLDGVVQSVLYSSGKKPTITLSGDSDSIFTYTQTSTNTIYNL